MSTILDEDIDNLHELTDNSVIQKSAMQKFASALYTEKLTHPTDEAWKDAIEFLFKELMAFCWPHIYNEIDWDAGIEFLDKELNTLLKYKKKGKKLADKLVKVRHRFLGQIIILLHMEVQNESDNELPLRMYQYNYRIFDHHTVPVVSLAVLIDNNLNWRPCKYESKYWECTIKFEFPIFKLLDYKPQIAMLEASDNPFALIVLYQLKALETKKDQQQRYNAKRELIVNLLRNNKWDKQKIVFFLKFLDGILRQSDIMESKLITDLNSELQGDEVSYITSFEYFAREKWLRAGIIEGRQTGIQEGRQTGKAEGKQSERSDMLRKMLIKKFIQIPNIYLEKIHSADLDTLSEWIERWFVCNTIEEIFE